MNIAKATAEVLQGILDAFAIPVSLKALPIWARILIVSVILSSVTVGLIQLVVNGKLWSRTFWSNSGKALPVLTCIMLVVSYRFAGVHDARPLGTALADAADTGLPRLIPQSILTQLVLVTIFWFIFGRLMDLPWRTLAAPYGSLALGAAGLLLMFPITTMWLALHRAGDPGTFALVLAGLIGLVGLWGYLVALYECSPLGRVEWKTRREQAQLGPSQPDADPRTKRMLLRFVEEPPPFRLWPGLRRVLRHTRQLSASVAFVAVAISLPYWAGWLDPPRPTAVLRVELVIYCIGLLIALGRFRDLAFEIPDLPAAMTAFVDLTLALSASMVAIAALPGANVTSGRAPPWTVAIGPPLLVALLLLVAVLVPNRSSTPRWTTCLTVSGAAAVLLVPLQALITAAILPIVGLLPWF
jgi:hypothetical protein